MNPWLQAGSSSKRGGDKTRAFEKPRPTLKPKSISLVLDATFKHQALMVETGSKKQRTLGATLVTLAPRNALLVIAVAIAVLCNWSTGSGD